MPAYALSRSVSGTPSYSPSRPPAAGPVLDEHGHVVHQPAQLGRDAVEGVGHQLLEPLGVDLHPVMLALPVLAAERPQTVRKCGRNGGRPARDRRDCHTPSVLSSGWTPATALLDGLRRRPAGRGHGRRVPAVHPRRGRVGQDPGAHPAHRLAVRRRATPTPATSSPSPSPARRPASCQPGCAPSACATDVAAGTFHAIAYAQLAAPLGRPRQRAARRCSSARSGCSPGSLPRGSGRRSRPPTSPARSSGPRPG